MLEKESGITKVTCDDLGLQFNVANVLQIATLRKSPCIIGDVTGPYFKDIGVGGDLL